MSIKSAKKRKKQVLQQVQDQINKSAASKPSDGTIQLDLSAIDTNVLAGVCIIEEAGATIAAMHQSGEKLSNKEVSDATISVNAPPGVAIEHFKKHDISLRRVKENIYKASFGKVGKKAFLAEARFPELDPEDGF